MRCLVIEDDANNLEKFKTEYNLNENSIGNIPITYVSDFVKSIKHIKEHLFEYDLIIIDINLDKSPEKNCNEILNEEFKNIITKQKIANFDLKNAGFYIYLLIIHMGFPNDRIAFLSAYINDENKQVNKNNNENFLKLKNAYKSGISNKQDITSIKEIIESMEDEEIVDKKRIISALNNDKTTIDKMNNALKIFIEKNTQDECTQENTDRPNSNQKNDTTSIQGHFDDFENAGINIMNKFAKVNNKPLADDANQQTKLISWITGKWITEDESEKYYFLRSAILNACINIREELSKKNDENLLFHKYISEQNSERKAMYNVKYFDGMLLVLQNIMPIRAPESKVKQELYKQILKTIVHPWEAARPDYPKKRYAREELFHCASSSIMNISRNWLMHSRLNEFKEEDVAFLFIIAMRSYFEENINNIKYYEVELFELLLKDYSKKNTQKETLENIIKEVYSEEYRISEKFSSLITESIFSMGDETKCNIRFDLNTYNMLSELGKKSNCNMNHLYKLFWHMMFYPYTNYKNLKGYTGTIYINYNTKSNDIYLGNINSTKSDDLKLDILSSIYICTFNKFFHE